jgi:subfamily B ATP-binding cassette protein MsbA
MHFLQNSLSHYILRLYREYLFVYKKQLIISSLLMVVVAASNGVILLTIKPTIDKIFIVHDRKYFLLIPMIYILVAVIKGIAEYFQNYLLKNTGQRLISDMQIKMYQNFLMSDFEIIKEYSSGTIISKFTNDIILMRGALLKFFEGISKHLISVIFCIAIMFYTEPRISWILFLIFPIAIYPIHLLGIKIEKSVIAAQKELEALTSNIQESLNSALEVKSYLGEQFEINKTNKVIETIFIHYKNSIKFDSLSSPIIETLGGIALACIIFYGANANSTPGSLFAFISAFSAAYRPFKSITALNIYFREGAAASKRIFALLDINKTHKQEINQVNIKDSIATIQIKNLSFKQGETLILDNINLNIKNPINIAIIGESGSGKTSLANIIAGFCTPSSGEILINDKNINLYSNISLRENIGYATQQAKIFNIKIKENISYPNSNNEIDKIIEAAKLALIDEFISSLSNKYNYIVQNNGHKFSAGQIQRISIARILYKNASLMIFDEATNSLDSNTEKQIEANILNNKEKINIFITHRIGSIQNFDQIILMHKGQIIEQGTHEELMKNNGEYFRLVEKNTNKLSKN